MDQHQPDNLPPELDELGKRLSTESPVASDRQLDRAMTRAQGARARKSSLLWRSSAPRAGRKGIAVAIAGVLAMAGVTGATVMSATAQVDSTPSEASCPQGVIRAVPIVGDLVNACVVVLPFDPNSDATCPDGAIQVDIDLNGLTQTCATVLVGADNQINIPIGGEGGGGGGLDNLADQLADALNNLLGGF